uniref:Uncharacterized protein n=1 Tax=Panagrolaimus sp. JU765 TaxID=591449 RepID=A0AC34QNI9_9BILA
MASDNKAQTSGKGRNQRFLANLQQSIGSGGNLKKQRQRPKVVSDDLPKDFDDFLRILEVEKRDISLLELGDYYKEHFETYDDDQVTNVAERLFKIGFDGQALYDFVAFLNIAFHDERFQQKMAEEFILHVANLFDLEEPEIQQYEELGRFIGLLLKTKFNRPFHQIDSRSNKFLKVVMDVFLGFLSDVPKLLDSNLEHDMTQAKWKTTSVVFTVKAMNRRLFMDFYELNDDIYKFIRSILIDTDGKQLGKEFRPVTLQIILDFGSPTVIMRFLLLVFLAIGFQQTQACRHGGSTYVNGQEWRERDAFMMRCSISPNGSWKTEVVACLSPNGQKIPINSSIEDGNDVWKCSMNERGMVTLVQGPNPNAKCDGHEIGSLWQEKSFQLECLPGGVRKLRACVTEDGQKIPVNSSKNVNGFVLICQAFANGTVSFHGQKTVKPSTVYGGSQTTIHCTDEQNNERNVGEHWIENHRFNKTCRANGAVEVVNCISKDGVQIPLNRNIVKDGSRYTCEMTPQGTIRFSAAPVDDQRLKFRKFFI